MTDRHDLNHIAALTGMPWRLEDLDGMAESYRALREDERDPLRGSVAGLTERRKI